MFELVRTVLQCDFGWVRVRAVTLRLRPCAGRDFWTADGYGWAHTSAYGRLRPKAFLKNRPAAGLSVVFISNVMQYLLSLALKYKLLPTSTLDGLLHEIVINVWTYHI